MPPSPSPTENSKTSGGGGGNTTQSTPDDVDNDDDDDDDASSSSGGSSSTNNNNVSVQEEKPRDFFSPFDTSDHSSTCSPPCSERTSCSNCTHGLCMWCKNLEMCIERNAYLVSVKSLLAVV